MTDLNAGVDRPQKKQKVPLRMMCSEAIAIIQAATVELLCVRSGTAGKKNLFVFGYGEVRGIQVALITQRKNGNTSDNNYNNDETFT